MFAYPLPSIPSYFQHILIENLSNPIGIDPKSIYWPYSGPIFLCLGSASLAPYSAMTPPAGGFAAGGFTAPAGGFTDASSEVQLLDLHGLHDRFSIRMY